MERLSSHGEMLSRVALEKLDHSSFDIGKHNFLSGKLGKIIPARISEVYPGDTIKGRTHIVANFEPLAGPIMGSMVCKQESFYVPYSIVWRNAHKFFTGKNGFDTPMPTITMERLYATYLNVLHIFELSDFYNVLFVYAGNSPMNVKLQALNDFIANMLDPFIEGCNFFGNRRGVLDLLLPIINKYNYYFTDIVEIPEGVSATTANRYSIAIALDIRDNTTDNILTLLSSLVEYIYNYLFGTSSMLDYMGVPIVDDWHEYLRLMVFSAKEASKETPRYVLPDYYFDIWSTIPFNWLPFRAAYCVWYWNYRDQLLELDALDPESDEFLSDSITPTELILLTLLRVRCWYKDTFTTALTNTGSGNFGVPINSSVRNVTFYSGDTLIDTKDADAALKAGATTANIEIGDITYSIPMNYLSVPNEVVDDSHTAPMQFMSLDLLDRVSRLRRFTRKELILGYEYDDVLWSNFRVRLSNVRMHIPELLDRGRDAVAINTIVNNTTTAEQHAGDKTAVAWAQGSSDGINYFVEEHGLYLHFFTIMPIQTYVGGMQRLYFKKERFDYMWPEFATMGMDAVYNFELAAPLGASPFAGLTDSEALAVFGYQGRYYDLKSEHDECHGNLRNTLSYMLFDRRFDSNNPPKLNYTFVHCWPRLDMFVAKDDSVDVIKTIDVHSAVDVFRTLPVESERV